MAIKRLTPTVRNLGSLRLWREDLAEMAALAGKLDDVSLVSEADDCELTDLEADLPALGPRLRYFTLKATRRTADAPSATEIMTVQLSRATSKIEATDPDLQTRAVMGSIEEYAATRRRMPVWFPYVYRPPEGTRTRPTGAPAIFWAVLWALAVIWALTAAVLAGANLDRSLFGATHPAPLAFSLGTGIPAAVIAIVLSVSTRMSRTLLFTGTRAEAPTFWQKNSAAIMIGIVIAVVFYLLGLVTHA